MQDSKKDSSIFPLRLQVFLAKAGIASRRAAEKLILQGKVCLNGQIASRLGTKVFENDEVLLEGKHIALEKHIYVLLNKPPGFICSSKDEKGRAVAQDLLKPFYSQRLFNVGRLDMYSQGLIIFTNDGDFAKALSCPKSQIEKEYVVDTVEIIPKVLQKDFEKGIVIEGIKYRCKKALLLTPHRMSIVLTEGKNREIRRVFACCNLVIRRLTRVRIGNIRKQNLTMGKSRELSFKEVKDLLALCKES